MGDVYYCDLAGLRAIASLAGARGGYGEGGTGAPRDGRYTRLALHDVPQPLRSVLQIMGGDRAPGLAIDA
jgi:hypothetical protein